MASNFFKKYLTKKLSHVTQENVDSNLEKLECLTKELMDQHELPDYTIMDMILELNDNGLLGIDSNGIITFGNSFASKIVKLKEIRGKSIFDVIDKKGAENLKDFMSGDETNTCIKLEFFHDNTVEYYDAAIFKMLNGTTFYIMFFINCLEKSVFSEGNCPLKTKCPFNHECHHKKIES